MATSRVIVKVIVQTVDEKNQAKAFTSQAEVGMAKVIEQRPAGGTNTQVIASLAQVLALEAGVKAGLSE